MPDDDILCNKTAVKEHGGAKIAAGDALPGGRVSGTRVATSCYRGVCWHRKSKRWQSAINSSGRHVYLGSFDTEEEAARMFDKVAIRIRGAKAKLNFPYKDYVGPDGEFLTDPKLEQLVHAAYKALLEKQQRHRAIEDGHAAGSGGGGGSGAGAKRRRLGSAAAGLASDDSEPGDLNCSVGLPLSAVPWNAGRLGWGPGPERCAGANVGYDFGCSPGGGGGDGSDAVMHPMHGAMGRTGLWGPVAGVVAPSGGHGPAEPLSPPSPTAPPAAGQCDAGMAPLTAQQPGDQRVPYHHHHQLQQQFQDQHFVPKDAIGLTPGHFGDHGCGGGLTATATAVAGASTGLPSAAVHNPPTPYGGTPRHRAYAGLCLDLGRPEVAGGVGGGGADGGGGDGPAAAAAAVAECLIGELGGRSGSAAPNTNCRLADGSDNGGGGGGSGGGCCGGGSITAVAAVVDSTARTHEPGAAAATDGGADGVRELDVVSLIRQFIKGINGQLPLGMEIDSLIPCADGSLLGYTLVRRVVSERLAELCSSSSNNSRSGSGSAVAHAGGGSGGNHGSSGSGGVNTTALPTAATAAAASGSNRDTAGDGADCTASGSCTCLRDRTHGGSSGIGSSLPQMCGSSGNSDAAGGGGGGSSSCTAGAVAGAGIFLRGTYRSLGTYSTTADAIQACKSCLTVLMEYKDELLLTSAAATAPGLRCGSGGGGGRPVVRAPLAAAPAQARPPAPKAASIVLSAATAAAVETDEPPERPGAVAAGVSGRQQGNLSRDCPVTEQQQQQQQPQPQQQPQQVQQVQQQQQQQQQQQVQPPPPQQVQVQDDDATEGQNDDHPRQLQLFVQRLIHHQQQQQLQPHHHQQQLQPHHHQQQLQPHQQQQGGRIHTHPASRYLVQSGRIVVLPREADFPEAVSAAAGIRTHSGSFISVADDVYDSLYDADNTLSHPKRTCISRQADGSDSGGFLRSYPRQVQQQGIGAVADADERQLHAVLLEPVRQRQEISEQLPFAESRSASHVLAQLIANLLDPSRHLKSPQQQVQAPGKAQQQQEQHQQHQHHQQQQQQQQQQYQHCKQQKHCYHAQQNEEQQQQQQQQQHQVMRTCDRRGECGSSEVVNDTEIVLFGGGGSGGGGGGGATAVSAAGGSPTSALVRGGKRNGVAADDGDGSGYGRNTSGSCDSTDDTFLPPPGLQRRLPPPSLHAVLPGGGGGSGGGGHNRDGGVCCPAGPRYPLHYPGRPVVVVQRANDPLASGEIRLGGGGGDDDAGGRVDRNGNHHPAQRHWDMGAAAIWRRHGEAAALASSSAAAAAAGAADGTAAAVTASAPTVLYEVADGMALTQTTTTLYGKRSPMHDQRRATSVSWWQYQQQSQQ